MHLTPLSRASLLQQTSKDTQRVAYVSSYLDDVRGHRALRGHAAEATSPTVVEPEIFQGTFSKGV